VFVEGDDNPVQTLNEIHQPDNLESTTRGLLITEDPGSTQQFPAGSTAPNATTARLWHVPFSGSPSVVVKVDQSADGGSTDVDGRSAGNWQVQCAPPSSVRACKVQPFRTTARGRIKAVLAIASSATDARRTR
jgi:hypothetical protein